MSSESQDTEPPTVFDESCCGDEIRTTVLGWQKKAWVACGTALEHFETKIMPHIGPILRNVELGDADLYMRLYMVGKTKETACPMIAVICSDVTVAKNSKKALKTSSLMINDHPSFNIGRFPRPLGHSTPIRPLAAKTQLCPSENLDFNFRDEPTLLSTSDSPAIGRPFVLASDTSRYATGGVITYLSEVDEHFQLTAGHLFDAGESTALPEARIQDEDACSFDGQSDGEERDESESQNEADSLSFASRSFCADDEDLLDKDSIFSNPGPLIETGFPKYHSPGNLASQNPEPKSFQADPEGLVEAGSLALHSRDGSNPQLDYALISIGMEGQGDEREVNVLNVLRDNASSTSLRIQHIATPQLDTKTPIFAVTNSGDLTSGLIIPGAMYVRKPQVAHFQAFGCNSANTAYVVPARDVFNDINSILSARIDSKVSEKPSIKTPTIQLGKKANPNDVTCPDSNIFPGLISAENAIAKGSLYLSKDHEASSGSGKFDSTTATLWQPRMLLFNIAIAVSTHLFVVLTLWKIIIANNPTPYWKAATMSLISSMSSAFYSLVLDTLWSYMGDLLASRWTVQHKQNANVRSPRRVLPYFASWSSLRFALPLIVALCGSIMKSDSDSEFYFIPTTPKINVTLELPNLIASLSDTMHTTSLLHDNPFHDGIQVENCTVKCTTHLLPPPLQSLITGNLDESLKTRRGFYSIILDTEAIRIGSAPGRIVQFRSLDSQEWAFEPETECSEFDINTWLYADNPAVICCKQVGESIQTGVALPSADPSDLKSPPWTSLSTITTWEATTSIVYDTKYASILETGPVSVGSMLPTNASDYMKIMVQTFSVSRARNRQDRLGDLVLGGYDAQQYMVGGMDGPCLEEEPNESSQQRKFSFLRWTFDLDKMSRILGHTDLPRNLLALPFQQGLGGLSGNSSTFVVSAQGGKTSTRPVVLTDEWWFLIATIIFTIFILSVDWFIMWMDWVYDGSPLLRKFTNLSAADPKDGEDLSGLHLDGRDEKRRG
ncbi:hypothetical protein V8F20_009828 [Naviculisporaceae sp. PSN 640]